MSIQCTTNVSPAASTRGQSTLSPMADATMAASTRTRAPSSVSVKIFASTREPPPASHTKHHMVMPEEFVSIATSLCSAPA
jgi:hypothetical protein